MDARVVPESISIHPNVGIGGLELVDDVVLRTLLMGELVGNWYPGAVSMSVGILLALKSSTSGEGGGEDSESNIITCSSIKASA